ncbi:hypothetical protein CGMCC3_g2818 [Colletotrichum fructicola]|nr:uncharacterized protein CGMCC3_g2818 [Colletotrichum fructicola]KAE9581498.1 hypothetical protein CGMCC3_g2818 [Colletotrichum fructicola]
MEAGDLRLQTADSTLNFTLRAQGLQRPEPDLVDQPQLLVTRGCGASTTRCTPLVSCESSALFLWLVTGFSTHDARPAALSLAFRGAVGGAEFAPVLSNLDNLVIVCNYERTKGTVGSPPSGSSRPVKIYPTTSASRSEAAARLTPFHATRVLAVM